MSDRPANYSDVKALFEEVGSLKETVAQHGFRFENGRHVFDNHTTRLQTIEEKITPKPPSLFKIVGITFSVMVAGAGALWALANTIRDRPTLDQLEKVIHKHDDVGHKTVREDVHEIQKEQGAQRVIIEGVQRQQEATNEKLDQIIEHTQPRWRRNGR